MKANEQCFAVVLLVNRYFATGNLKTDFKSIELKHLAVKRVML